MRGGPCFGWFPSRTTAATFNGPHQGEDEGGEGFRVAGDQAHG
jgi:hypothetical protein